MKLLFDFFPLLLYFVVFKAYDIFVATAVAIAAAFAQVAWVYFRHRKFEQAHVITLAVLFVFGGMTLIFRNDAFIMWKPSIVNWIFAVLVLGSIVVGEKPVIQRLMGSQLDLPSSVWKTLSIAWGIFFVFMGLLNLYVAFYYQPDLPHETRVETWVNFKVFWMLGITLVFTILQMFYLAKHIDPETLKKDGEE